MANLIKIIQNRTPLGLLQLKHDKVRLITALSGIAFADILVFMQLGFLSSLNDSSVLLHRALKTDLVMMNPQALHWSELSTFPRRRLYQAMDVPGVASTEALYINSVRWKNPQTRQKTSVMILGMNVDSPAFNFPEVNHNLDKIKQPDTFLFDRASRGEYAEAIAAYEQGQTVTTEIERRTITVGGLFTLGSSFGSDATLISSDHNFLRLFPKRQAGTVSLGLIKLKPDADATQVKNALNDYLSELEDIRVMTIEEFIKFEQTYWGRNRPVGVVFAFGTIIGFIVGVVIVYQILSTDVNDHLAEYATFKAMGYRNSYLLGIVFEEAIILAVCGFIPSLGISLGLYSLVRKATALPVYLTLLRTIGVFLLTLVMCTISGAIATRKLQSADPADIF
ncbi:MAG: FtsX-like permease family protein [Symploca sp. SIO3C6]|uniref:FtsX-like permease family protein n=1 Tax=Symploca sp. SIO1C4 TaxID=2607765 RepID=A0A6B3NMY2_9CYAN|nr:FtsX-like permease family protein [Symploca sp. SIO3C6]NER30901.1 FtsX-like permease family protein [Symploca sp. SIO1C4]NET07084.1 FtsX-like permease family protein [Symploca sp. SIO2B6]